MHVLGLKYASRCVVFFGHLCVPVVIFVSDGGVSDW